MRMGIKLLAAAATMAIVAGALWIGPSYADGWGHGPGGWHGGGPGEHGSALFEAFDTNGDGRLTQAEIDAARDELFGGHDREGDGRLTLEEYQALWLEVTRPRMVDAFQAHDDDGDAAVTEAEFAAHSTGMVSWLDRDGDGQLTADELRWGHARHDHWRGGERDDD